MTDTENQSQDPLWGNLQQYASGAPEEVANTAKSLVPEQPQDTLATRSARGELSPGQAVRQTAQQDLSPQSIQQVAENTANAATPTGNIQSAIDASKAYNRGDWLGTALGAIGSVPMVGGIFLPARKAQIAKALQMEQAGAHANDIWREANVYKGPEGNWWREISDLPSKPTEAAKTFLETNTSAAGKAPQIYSHPELYKEVPQVKDYDLSYFKTKPRLTASDPEYSIAREQKAAEMEAQGVNPTEIYRRTGASRNPQGEWTQYNDPEGLHYGSKKAIEVHAPNMNDFRSTTIHELQHAADKAHGFTSGASPEELYWDVAQQPLEDVVKQAQASRAAGSRFAPDIENYADNPDKFLQKMSNDLYHRDSSEVRARTAQGRLKMTDEQRAAKIPTASMDVPLEQQIVRGKSSDKTASVNPDKSDYAQQLSDYKDNLAKHNDWAKKDLDARELEHNAMIGGLDNIEKLKQQHEGLRLRLRDAYAGEAQQLQQEMKDRLAQFQDYAQSGEFHPEHGQALADKHIGDMKAKIEQSHNLYRDALAQMIERQNAEVKKAHTTLSQKLADMAAQRAKNYPPVEYPRMPTAPKKSYTPIPPMPKLATEKKYGGSISDATRGLLHKLKIGCH